jgi:hypothetical protein
VCFGGQFSYPGYQKNETGIFRRKFPLFFKNIRQFFFLNIWFYENGSRRI